MRGSLHWLLVGLALLQPAAAATAEDPPADRAIGWLERYLTIDSSTVEGSHAAAGVLRDVLHRAGVKTQWIVSPAGQPFLYARTGSGAPDARALLLLHHLDVVPAGPDWSYPPFAAEVVDGAMYGRGAVDDKSLGIAHLVSFLRFDRLPEPSQALIFLAVGGEETGGSEGTGWLVEHHPELFADVAGVLTEGGSNRIYGQKVAWWAIEVAQKRPLWLEATASGRPGHGSAINLHSAPHRLIRGLERLVEQPLDFRLTPEARQFLQAVAPLESPAYQKVIANLDSILQQQDVPERLLPGMPGYLLDTLQVNVLEAGTDVNVTPGTARARIDMRLLPDTDEQALLTRLRELAGPEVELEVLLSSPRVKPSPVDGPLFTCLERVLGERAPVVPAFITAVTDARFLRRHDIPVYGFLPFELGPDALRGIHSADEHIPLDVFRKGVETMWRVVRECAGGS